MNTNFYEDEGKTHSKNLVRLNKSQFIYTTQLWISEINASTQHTPPLVWDSTKRIVSANSVGLALM